MIEMLSSSEGMTCHLKCAVPDRFETGRATKLDNEHRRKGVEKSGKDRAAGCELMPILAGRADPAKGKVTLEESIA